MSVQEATTTLYIFDQSTLHCQLPIKIMFLYRVQTFSSLFLYSGPSNHNRNFHCYCGQSGGKGRCKIKITPQILAFFQSFRCEFISRSCLVSNWWVNHKVTPQIWRSLISFLHLSQVNLQFLESLDFQLMLVKSQLQNSCWSQVYNNHYCCYWP